MKYSVIGTFYTQVSLEVYASTKYEAEQLALESDDWFFDHESPVEIEIINAQETD